MHSGTNRNSKLSLLVKLVIPCAILAAGGAAWAYFQATAPTIKRTPPKATVPLVDVLVARPSDAKVVVQAMGVVTPSREVTLKSRVSGEVLRLSDHFEPGGLIAKGEVILALDPADYEVDVAKAESALMEARAKYALEQGSQTIAREELRLLRESSKEDWKATDLALRKPQLQQAQAAVESAQAELRKARLNLERTVVRAPFNAMVVARTVNLGSHVNTQDALATIVSTDEYWIEAAIAVDRLGFLELSGGAGARAVIKSQAGGGLWRGEVVRAAGKLNENSRLAKVIIRIQDPLGLREGNSAPRLMLNDYVSVEIEGSTLPGIMELPRSVLRDGDTVWLNKNGSLVLTPVEVAWKQGEKVFVASGLAPGDQVIISNLATPVPGMKLALAKSATKVGKLASGEKGSVTR